MAAANAMLSFASWRDRAEALDVGGRARVDHDCGGGRTLTIRRDERGLHAFCFRCNDSGYVPPPPEPLAVRLKRLQELSTKDSAVPRLACVPPAPAVRVWDEWPDSARLWLIKAGLSRADLPALGAYYHPPTQRVVLPVLDPLAGLVFWQARALDGRQPKYLAPDVSKATVVPRYGQADSVVLTEDLLSAYKVGKVHEAWCLLGTKASQLLISRLVERRCKVYVWLDPDAAGRKAATSITKSLRSVGIDCVNVVSDTDPKLVHSTIIKEYLS